MKGCDKVRKTNSIAPEKPQRRSRPALDPDARENQLISLAVEVAEEQLQNRTASSQVITHYLRMGSKKERLEREKLERENELLVAKIEAMQSMQNMEEAYTKAIDAMRLYSGKGGAVDED